MFISQSTDPRSQTNITVQLTQTMRLLEMNATELGEEMTREMQANPALQLNDELRCQTCGRKMRALPCPRCMRSRADNEPIVFLSPRTLRFTASRPEADTDHPSELIAQTESLADHILRQVACSVNEQERLLAAEILARIDERGLLKEHPAELALTLKAPPDTIRRVLHLIQRADPAGVGTADLRESLLVQLEALSDGKRHKRLALAERILLEGWDDLVKRNYAPLARRFAATPKEVSEAIWLIRRNLTPYPARAWTDTGRGTIRLARDVFYDPDILISSNQRPGGPLVVEVFTGLGGTLQVDPAIKAGIAHLSDNERAEWASYIERALLIAKCVQQRNNTMRRIAQIITTEQMPFIVGGDADLRPLTRSAIARQLELHESTVSRAVANKTAALPNGRIVPLSIFFDRSLAVRDAVHSLISREEKCQPLSDTQIAELLKPQGYSVARRTVAKYRQMLGILPANLRAREMTP